MTKKNNAYQSLVDKYAVIEIAPCYYKSKMRNLYKKDGSDCRAIEFVGTKDECQKHIILLAREKGGFYYDDDAIKLMQDDFDTSWYEDEGVYDGENRFIYDPEIEVYHDDYRDFKIVSLPKEFGRILTNEGPEASGSFIKEAFIFSEYFLGGQDD